MLNVKETQALPFFLLVSPEAAKKIEPGSQQIPEEALELANALGATDLQTPVPFTLSLGSLFFDIYNTTKEKPRAPIKAEKDAAKRRDVAIALDQESFELDEEVKSTVEKAVDDDALWDKVQVSIEYEDKVQGKPDSLKLASVVVEFFPEVRKALVSTFL